MPYNNNDSNREEQQQANSLEANKLLIKSFIEQVLNKHNVAAIDKYYAPNLIQHSPSMGQGIQGFKEFFTSFFLAFPDIHAAIEHILVEKHVVLVFLNWTGTHKGEFQGMPTTNRPINMRTADLFKIDYTNGTIVEHWAVVDLLNLLQQTGMITLIATKCKK